MNALAFNVGYHNEHHDLMRVPWSRLPALRRLAPELYEPLHHHRSWTRLIVRFILDPTLSLYSRVTRSVPGAPDARGEGSAAAPTALDAPPADALSPPQKVPPAPNASS
jgi:sphingolipid delta-4 desaturase